MSRIQVPMSAVRIPMELLDRNADHLPDERYEVLGELGRGGMGVVYKARDRETDAVVAVKTLKSEIAGDEQMMEWFKNELLLARRITHKNVCRIHEFNRAGESAYISMEYVEGESLRVILDRFEGLSTRMCIKLAQQICSGLAEAHGQNIVHRDLKPENLMLDRDGNLKIMDFGLARMAESTMVTADRFAGTPAYMAPEQVEGRPVDQRTDIYAVGLILYEMFTGEAAFRGDTPAELALRQVKELPIPPRDIDPDIPPHIEKLVLKCLQKDPDRRFQSVNELESALTPQARRRAVPAGQDLGRITLPPELTNWMRADWLLVAAMVAGLLLFFPFFHRTSLAPLSKLSFDRGALPLIARDYAERAGMRMEQLDEVRIAAASDGYNGYGNLASQYGAVSARAVMNRPVPVLLGVVTDRNGTRVTVDHQGNLVSIRLDSPSGSRSNALPIEQQRIAAEGYVRDLFDRDPAGMRFIETPEGSPAVPGLFEWEAPSAPDTGHRYEIRLADDQLISAIQIFRISQVEQDNGLWRLLLYIAFGLVIFLLGLAGQKSADLTARWRLSLAVIALVTGIWITRNMLGGTVDREIVWIAASSIGIASIFWCIFATVPLERSFRRMWPEKFTTLVRFFRGEFRDQACGVSIVRGAMLGLMLLGMDFFLTWIGTRFPGMRLAAYDHIVILFGGILGESITSLPTILLALWVCTNGLLVVGLICAIAARRIRSRLALVVGTGILVALFLPVPGVPLAAIVPYTLSFPLLAVESMLLVWILLRFDLLTVAAALFTYLLWWGNYPVLVVREAVGTTEQWLVFAAWGVLVLAAAAAAFQTRLRSIYRRVSAAVE